MSLDTNTVARIARLARLRLEPEQLAPMADELNRILGFVEQLGAVDVNGAPPMTSVTPMTLRVRADQVTDGGQQDKVLQNAPQAESGYFTVPKVIE